jgi:hypothetical protein
MESKRSWTPNVFVSSKLLKGKAEGAVFWSIAIPATLIEPLTNPGTKDIELFGAIAVPFFVSILFLIFSLYG